MQKVPKGEELCANLFLPFVPTLVGFKMIPKYSEIIGDKAAILIYAVQATSLKNKRSLDSLLKC